MIPMAYAPRIDRQMVVLPQQSRLGTSDAEAIELALVDLRWQMVLGFREQLISDDMDRRLLERTVLGWEPRYPDIPETIAHTWPWSVS